MSDSQLPCSAATAELRTELAQAICRPTQSTGPVKLSDQLAAVLAIFERERIPDDAQTRRDLTEDQIMSVLRRTVQGELLGLLTIKGLIPSMAAECLAREFIAAFQPSPAAPVETKAKYCECFGSIPGLAATTHCPSSSSQPHCDLCGWPILPAPRSSAASESRSFYEAASREYLVEQAIGLTAALEESRQEVASLRAVPQPPSKMLTMLAILDAAGGQTEASDSKWCWLNYFCEDTDSTDTFNQAVDAKLIRVSHDSRFDSSTVYLTEAGRAAASALSRPHHSGDK